MKKPMLLILALALAACGGQQGDEGMDDSGMMADSAQMEQMDEASPDTGMMMEDTSSMGGDTMDGGAMDSGAMDEGAMDEGAMDDDGMGSMAADTSGMGNR